MCIGMRAYFWTTINFSPTQWHAHQAKKNDIMNNTNTNPDEFLTFIAEEQAAVADKVRFCR